MSGFCFERFLAVSHCFRCSCGHAPLALHRSDVQRKSCKATCRCGVAENLVKPGAPAIWQKEEVPKPKCKRYATQGSNPAPADPYPAPADAMEPVTHP